MHSNDNNMRTSARTQNADNHTTKSQKCDRIIKILNHLAKQGRGDRINELANQLSHFPDISSDLRTLAKHAGGEL